MAELPYSEEDQAEQLKKWWKQNGSSIIFGVVLGLAIVGGYNYWQHYQKSQSENASELYERMLIAYSNGKAEEAQKLGEKVMSEYSSTPYASKASLYMARISFDKKDLAATERQLQWALDNASDPATKHSARLRLARVLLDSNKDAQAKSLLSVTEFGGFESEYKELEGDIAMRQNKPAEARTAYKRALQVMPKESGYQPLLKAKLDHALAQERS